MLNRYRITDTLIAPDESLDASIAVYMRPDDTEKHALRETYGIDEHTLGSALDPDEPSRLEVSDNCLSLIFKVPQRHHAQDQYRFAVASVGLFLFAERLIIVSSDELDLRERHSLRNVKNLIEVFLKILLDSIHQYHGHLKAIIEMTEEIEKQIMTSAENKQLTSLFVIEKSLVFYVYALESNGVALDKLRLAAEKNSGFRSHMGLLDDIVIENNQCSRQAEIYSSILANLMDARVSLISNNLNILMKTLNVVTICIMVPTLIVSIFSMNIVLPFETHPKAFWIVLILSVLSVLGVLLWWRWLSAKLKRQVF